MKLNALCLPLASMALLRSNTSGKSRNRLWFSVMAKSCIWREGEEETEYRTQDVRGYDTQSTSVQAVSCEGQEHTRQQHLRAYSTIRTFSAVVQAEHLRPSQQQFCCTAAMRVVKRSTALNYCTRS